MPGPPCLKHLFVQLGVQPGSSIRSIRSFVIVDILVVVAAAAVAVIVAVVPVAAEVAVIAANRRAVRW